MSWDCNWTKTYQEWYKKNGRGDSLTNYDYEKDDPINISNYFVPECGLAALLNLIHFIIVAYGLREGVIPERRYLLVLNRTFADIVVPLAFVSVYVGNVGVSSVTDQIYTLVYGLLTASWVNCAATYTMTTALFYTAIHHPLRYSRLSKRQLLAWIGVIYILCTILLVLEYCSAPENRHLYKMNAMFPFFIVMAFIVANVGLHIAAACKSQLKTTGRLGPTAIAASRINSRKLRLLRIQQGLSGVCLILVAGIKVNFAALSLPYDGTYREFLCWLFADAQRSNQLFYVDAVLNAVYLLRAFIDPFFDVQLDPALKNLLWKSSKPPSRSTTHPAQQPLSGGRVSRVGGTGDLQRNRSTVSSTTENVSGASEETTITSTDQSTLPNMPETTVTEEPGEAETKL